MLRKLLGVSQRHGAEVLQPLPAFSQAKRCISPSILFPDTGIEVPVYSLDFQQVGTTKLPEDVFGVEVRKDILHRVVRWQLARRRQGTHKVKGRGEVSGSTRKPHAQKGTGRARQGSIRAPHMRGGGIVHGPVTRSHEYPLQKKVRRLGLKCALSARAQEQRIWIMDSLALPAPKTKILDEMLGRFFEEEKDSRRSLLLVDDRYKDPEEAEQVRRAASNIHYVDILPTEGLNVYSILQKHRIMMTKNALDSLLERLRTPIFHGPLDRARWQAALENAAAAQQLQQ